MRESILRSQPWSPCEVEQGARCNDKIIVIQPCFLACADFFTQDILVSGVRMNFFCRGMDEFNIHSVVDWLELEDGLFWFHVANADPADTVRSSTGFLIVAMSNGTGDACERRRRRGWKPATVIGPSSLRVILHGERR
mgnify:CR=1 FL=1